MNGLLRNWAPLGDNGWVTAPELPLGPRSSPSSVCPTLQPRAQAPGEKSSPAGTVPSRTSSPGHQEAGRHGRQVAGTGPGRPVCSTRGTGPCLGFFINNRIIPHFRGH